MDRRLLKPLLLVTIVLILPVVLLAVRGESFAAELQQWQSAPPSRGTLAALVIGILAVDVVLPVPSGPISTLAGSHLGILAGTAASTVGMTLGAVIAFALARGVGSIKKSRAAAHVTNLGRSSENVIAENDAKTSSEAQEACRVHGPWLLVITRPLPIIAEAAVLLVGGLQMPWRTFLPTVIVSNLVLSATYAVLGQQAAAHGWLPLAVCTSIALPLGIALACRRHLRGGS
ncbi:MAG TPA: VTT domain-containing protein [Lacipirellula sp.]